MNKKGVNINAQLIVGIILAMVFVRVLMGVLPTILPGVITDVNTLFNSANLANATLVGTGPASFASNATNYLGWFWVIGPFVLVLGIALYMYSRSGFKGGRKGGYRRGYRR